MIMFAEVFGTIWNPMCVGMSMVFYSDQTKNMMKQLNVIVMLSNGSRKTFKFFVTCRYFKYRCVIWKGIRWVDITGLEYYVRTWSKVQLFWERHKNWCNHPEGFDFTSLSNRMSKPWGRLREFFGTFSEKLNFKLPKNQTSSHSFYFNRLVKTTLFYSKLFSCMSETHLRNDRI